MGFWIMLLSGLIGLALVILRFQKGSAKGKENCFLGDRRCSAGLRCCLGSAKWPAALVN